MKTEMIGGWLAKLALTVVGAVTIGGGGAILASAQTNAVQDQRLTALETTVQKMDKLSDQLDETNKNVAVLNERLNQETPYGQPSGHR